jgi:hypothetical protein
MNADTKGTGQSHFADSILLPLYIEKSVSHPSFTPIYIPVYSSFNNMVQKKLTDTDTVKPACPEITSLT